MEQVSPLNEIKIEKGLWGQWRAKSVRYPWKKMDIGDSFLVRKGEYKRLNLYSNAAYHGVKISVRKIDADTSRIFRIG